MKPKIEPINLQRKLSDQDIISSKTDLHGRITYANRTFMEISGYSETELLNQQHNIIRHPDMPRGVFHLMWQILKSGQEFFGFVKNLSADGGYYWVFATITPYFDSGNKIRGYYSIRRNPPDSALEVMTPIYQEMLRIEHENPVKMAPYYSIAYLNDMISQSGVKSFEKMMLKLFKPSGL
jgi:PAS domain S-box-containing protein